MDSCAAGRALCMPVYASKKQKFGCCAHAKESSHSARAGTPLRQQSSIVQVAVKQTVLGSFKVSPEELQLKLLLPHVGFAVKKGGGAGAEKAGE